MKKLGKIVLSIIVVCMIIGLAANLIHTGNVDVLNPKGIIADQQRNLLVFTVMLSLLVVIPVFTLLAIISWKYRAGNTKAVYRPDWGNNKWLELAWWGIPCIIIFILSVVTWTSSHELDPYRALQSDKKPVNVQVVALQWKWLFIYPDYNIASVNELRIPNQIPINFTITSDAPMNSFWIPSLGGQIYAMSGMSTKLHLMADKEGTYKGSSANISGEGFAKMKFATIASSQSDFDAWVKKAQISATSLNQSSYDELAKPKAGAVTYYSLSTPNLYDTIVMKYMMPATSTHTDSSMSMSSGGMN